MNDHSAGQPFYITTAIPYVNAAPHLGHALEFVQADVLARHQRLRGRPVRLLSGTDDHALKNVTAARAAGEPVSSFVANAADRFEGLTHTLSLSCDDFIRTSSDPRHRSGVEHLWRRCTEAGDFYRQTYTGLYCAGCEQFYDESELPEGRCPEHGTAPDQVSETNWFFRLSAYTDAIRDAITSGRLRINPESKRNEVLALLDEGLRDFSVSRPAARADGWGIPVPGDPDQVVYVWWEALTNYITALAVDLDSVDFDTWWARDGERVHVIGKGITRFHALYWTGLLLSAGLPLPTTIHVHDYLNLGGAKLSKSSGNVLDPVTLVDGYGVDALRWWFVREVPLLGDTEFTAERLVGAFNTDLANGLGNLVNRTLSLLNRHFDGRLIPEGVARGDDWSSLELDAAAARLPARLDQALADADFRAATRAIAEAVQIANQLLNAASPWLMLKSEGDHLAEHRLLSQVARACRRIVRELGPFVPDGAAALAAQLGRANTVGTRQPVFSRIDGPLAGRQVGPSASAG